MTEREKIILRVGEMANELGYQVEWLLNLDDDEPRDYLMVWSGEFVMFEGSLGQVFEFLAEELDALNQIDVLLAEIPEATLAAVVYIPDFPDMATATGLRFTLN